MASAGRTPRHGTDGRRWAIMTTDAVTKEAVAEGAGWCVGGMAKGAGMVRPDMATMLAFITTDALVDADGAPRHRPRGGRRWFVQLAQHRRVRIDERHRHRARVQGHPGVTPDPTEFVEAIRGGVSGPRSWPWLGMPREHLAWWSRSDVRGASDDATARMLGRVVADSALVRASFYGGDVNWGRILGALGASARSGFSIDDVSVAYNGVTVAERGVGVAYDEASLLDDCATGDLALEVGVGTGEGSALIVTTDLTPEYVVFNGERS